MSTIRVDNFAPSAGGTEFGIEGIAKAHAFITPTAISTGSPIYNVSSFVDNGVGISTVNFTNPFDIIPNASATHHGTGAIIVVVLTASGTAEIRRYSDAGVAADAVGMIAAFGDLA